MPYCLTKLKLRGWTQFILAENVIILLYANANTI